MSTSCARVKALPLRCALVPSGQGAEQAQCDVRNWFLAREDDRTLRGTQQLRDDPIAREDEM